MTMRELLREKSVGKYKELLYLQQHLPKLEKEKDRLIREMSSCSIRILELQKEIQEESEEE